MNIVIVDDEPKIRNGLLKLLDSHEGWNVTGVFEEAKAALQFLHMHEADMKAFLMHKRQLSWEW